jgi:hypothetical protein
MLCVLFKDDGVIESPICGVLQALRCSMHAYARPRQQSSQIIRIWNFRSTPSSGYTPRPSTILLSPRILHLSIQLACTQRLAQLTVYRISDDVFFLSRFDG